MLRSSIKPSGLKTLLLLAIIHQPIGSISRGVFDKLYLHIEIKKEGVFHKSPTEKWSWRGNKQPISIETYGWFLNIHFGVNKIIII